MKAVSYRITEDCRLESVPPEQVGDNWKADDAAYWLDIQGSGEDALEHYLRGVEVNQIIVQLFKDTKDTGSIARVIPTEDQVFFNLPVHTGGDHDTVGHLGALCLPRLLVTFHEQPVDSLDTLATVLQHTTLLRTSTTSALVCLMLMKLSSQSNQVAERVSRRVIHLAAQMDRDANVVKMEQILAEKANLRALEAHLLALSIRLGARSLEVGASLTEGIHELLFADPERLSGCAQVGAALPWTAFPASGRLPRSTVSAF